MKMCTQLRLPPSLGTAVSLCSSGSFLVQNIPDSVPGCLTPTTMGHKVVVLSLSGPLVAIKGTNMGATLQDPSFPASLKTLALTPRK